MSMIYKWTENFHGPIGAQIAAERLGQIRESAGAITPRAVVDDAQNSNSPLHVCFEWNDAIAADQHRLQRARQLVGALIVVCVNGEDVRKETRGFVHVSLDNQPRYEPVEVAMARSDMRADVLQQARRQLAVWRARYAGLEEFARLHSQIDAELAENIAS